MISKQTLLGAAILIVWLLTGCSSAHIHYNGQEITMQVDKTLVQIAGRLVGEKRQNFSSLYLSQKIIQTREGNLVVYENRSLCYIDYANLSTFIAKWRDTQPPCRAE